MNAINLCRRAPRWRDLVDLALVVLGAPVLLFPTALPAATLLVLTVWGVWWAACLVVDRQGTIPVTPFNAALLFWCIAVAVGVMVTAFPELTLSKATGLLLGLAAWRLLAVVVHDRRRLGWAVAGYVLLGLSFAGIGFVTVRWGSKVPVLSDVVAWLPERLLVLPEGPESGVNANQLAGVLVTYLPMGVAALVALVARRSPSTATGGGQRRPWYRFALWASAGALTMVAGGGLLLTQSRSGWVAGAVAVATLIWATLVTTGRPAARRAAVGLVCVLAVVGAAVLWGIAQQTELDLWQGGPPVATDVTGPISLSGRVEIWSRALYAIQDFPFTGCGLGTFRRIVPLLYPLFTISPTIDIAHAHNIFLQVAVDVGIPGLVAYLALLGVATKLAWQLAERDRRDRLLALGILSGIVGLHVYGLTDALAPGSKPGLIFWVALGLLTANWRISEDERRAIDSGIATDSPSALPDA